MVNQPGYTVCGLPGCHELTRGNYCPDHAELTPEQEDAEIRRLRALRLEAHDEGLDGEDGPE